MRTLSMIGAGLLAATALLAAHAPAQAQSERRGLPSDEADRLMEELDRRLDNLRQEFDQRLNQLRGHFERLLRGRGDSTQRQPDPGSGGEPRREGRAWLGVAVGEIEPDLRALLDLPDGQGVIVTSVVPDSPAAVALEAFDVILAVDGEPVRSPQMLTGFVRERRSGDVLHMDIVRQGERRDVRVTLGEFGASEQPRPAPPGDLREFLERSFRDRDRQDPAPPQDGLPFGDDMGRALQDMLERLFEPRGPGGEGNPLEGIQELLERLLNPNRDGEGEGRRPGPGANPMEGIQELLERLLNPNRDGDGEEANPLGGLRDFMDRLLDPNREGNGEAPANPLEGLRERFERFLEPREPSQPRRAQAWLGFTGENPSEDMVEQGQHGVLVTDVAEGGPAANADLRVGDMVVGIGNHNVRNLEDIRTAMLRLRPGNETTIRVLRDGETLELALRVGTRPR